jgi:hypothetical protein
MTWEVALLLPRMTSATDQKLFESGVRTGRVADTSTPEPRAASLVVRAGYPGSCRLFVAGDRSGQLALLAAMRHH